MEIKDLVHQGIAVDDDNEPTPENNNPILAGDVAPLEGTWKSQQSVLVMQTCHLLVILGNGRTIQRYGLLRV